MRVHYMDALRSVLMLLGVVYHTALVYGPDFDWLVASPNTDTMLGYTAQFLHSFRMPAFFIVAGYFTALLLSRYSESRFLSHRLQRIGIPLLATAVLINPWINYIALDKPAASDFFSYLLSEPHLSGGEWIHHLWFLANLLVYYVAALMVLKLGRPWVQKRLPRITALGQILNIPLMATALILLLPVVNMAFFRVAWNLPGIDHNSHIAGFVTLYSLAEFAPYFAFGCLLWTHRGLQEHFASAYVWLPALLLAGALLWVAPAVHGPAAPRYAEYAWILEAWGMSSLCFAVFRRLCDRPSPTFAYLSGAAYTIYLVHMLFVLAFALYLIQTDLHPIVQFLLVCISTAAASLLIHHYLILRVPFLQLLFNGKIVRAEGVTSDLARTRSSARLSG